jgi:hypothetical protein
MNVRLPQLPELFGPGLVGQTCSPISIPIVKVFPGCDGISGTPQRTVSSNFVNLKPVCSKGIKRSSNPDPQVIVWPVGRKPHLISTQQLELVHDTQAV